MKPGMFMESSIKNNLEADKEYRFLELTPQTVAWPRRDGCSRVLLVAFNVPGYYSMAIRSLALTSTLCEETNGSHDVRYVEINVNDDREPLLERIRCWEPTVVGFSVNIWNLTVSMDFIKAVRKLLPSTAILLGGQEVTGSAAGFMKNHAEIEYVIEGEGEIPFLQFLAGWDPGTRKLADPANVSGLTYRDNGLIVTTGPARIVPSLDDLPSPILAGLVPVHEKNKLGVMLEGARGCPFRCSFCFEGARSNKVRTSSLARLAAEARHMASRGATYFHIMDPILCNSEPERLKGLSGLFRDLSRRHKMQVSLETYAQHIDDRTAAHLSEFTIIDVGLQSINPATLREIRRSFRRDRFLKGLASIRKVTPNFNIYLICGLPHETLTTFLKGILFVLGERPARIFINELCLLNGTELRWRHAEYGYDFNPSPPYRVYASRWMNHFEMQLANVLSSVVYRGYNSSIRALFPSAPWIRTLALPTGKTVAFELHTECRRTCPGCSAAADSRTTAGPDAWESLIRDAAGADVEILGADPVHSPAGRRLSARLQFAGAARLKMTSPPEAFADPEMIEKLVSNGVLHYKTFLASTELQRKEQDPLSDHAEDRLRYLKNITRAFSIKGYSSIRPISELVVIYSGEAPETYRKAVDLACRCNVDLVSIPLILQDRGEAWVREMADCFRENVRTGTWLKVPEGIARAALKDVRDLEAVLSLLKQLGLLSDEPNTPPCMVSEQSTSRTRQHIKNEGANGIHEYPDIPVL
jgi:radical SAM superfamily enzyme YgiQ (UPF0313 family)